MMRNPYAPRDRAVVLVMSLLMPLLLAWPLILRTWHADQGTVTVALRAAWLTLPAFWTARILRLVARRQRQGHPADEQTALLFRVAMVLPVVGYVPMLWLL